MQRVIRIFGWMILIISLLFVVDYYRVRAKERRVSASVSQLGGGMYSIPFWPFGTEYRIVFKRSLTPDEIETVNELNDLRGSVIVQFNDCDLSDEQLNVISGKLTECLVVEENTPDHDPQPP